MADFDPTPDRSAPLFLGFRREEWLPALALGGLCGVLVVLMAQGRLSGILVNYLPTLLLFGLGWTRGVRAFGLGALAASLICLALAPAAATTFLVLEAMPALLMLRLSLTYLALGRPRRDAPDAPMALHVTPAFPIGWCVSALAVYGACMLAVFTLLVPGDATLSAGKEGGLDWQALDIMLAGYLPDAAARKALIEQLRNSLFLVLGLVGWLWVLGLYGCAALARYLAESFSAVAPRRLGLKPFAVPVAMLAMLAAFGAGALLLPPASLPALLLKSAFVLLLLPYFLSGVALLLGRLPPEQSRTLWTMLLVMGLAVFPLGALIFIAMGLLHPLKSPSPSVRD